MVSLILIKRNKFVWFFKTIIGKTTILRAILGRIDLDSGKINVFNQIIFQRDLLLEKAETCILALSYNYLDDVQE